MTVDIHIVDAFTDKPFSGNPAAVVLLDRRCEDSWMQSVATEMNLSETAFVDLNPSDPGGTRSLRWFTPVAEVEICGHATLATTHILGGSQRYATMSGELQCTARSDGWVEMDFPADMRTVVSNVDAHLRTGLPGVTFVSVASGQFTTLIEAASADEVRNVQPDFAAISKVASKGVIVTARSDEKGIDFVSRSFFPSLGIPEDPVTGAAHCTLACWWAPQLGRTELTGKQLSQRGGVVKVAVNGDRVTLAGRAVSVMSGKLVADKFVTCVSE